jgi:hypothetical protein
MECKHPVLYHVNGVLTCHICGAVIEPTEHKGGETAPVEGQKKPVKRKAKKEA